MKQVSERLAISRSLVYALIASGVLPAVRIGTGRGTLRVFESEVTKLLDRPARPRQAGYELRHLKLPD